MTSRRIRASPTPNGRPRPAAPFGRRGGSNVPPPACHAALVLFARLSHVTRFGDLGDRHLPPALVVGNAFVAIYRDIDHHRAIDWLGRDQRVAKFLDVSSSDHVRAEALRVQSK